MMHHRRWLLVAVCVTTQVVSACVSSARQAVAPPQTRAVASAVAAQVYFPPAGAWERRKPSEVGMDDALLAEAIAWARMQPTDMPKDFSTQAEIFGRPLGPVPGTRADMNGVVIRRGYIVAEFGDIEAVDPTYSCAKSYLSTLLGVAVDRGLIKDVHDHVRGYLPAIDHGYDSPHNARVTWAQHVTQTSEWDGDMFGKPSSFIGKDEFGREARKPRELREPGTFYEYNDVRVNRFSLSLLEVWKRPLPEVLKSEIMDPIGASGTWVYHGYDNAEVEVDGKKVKSVSGGTRWGGGLWISTLHHARFGYLMLRKGEWDGKRIVSEEWIAAATRQQGVKGGYGYLWWLNSEGAWPKVPRSSYAAIGAGSNTVWIDPEDDLVVVWRWHRGGDAMAGLYERVVRAITPDGR